MDAIHYLDFDLRIERVESGYRAQVINSPAGQAAADFQFPFSDLELENFFLRVGQTRRVVRRIESPETEAAKVFGSRLFNAIFPGDVRGCLRSSLDEASRQGAGLRLRLRLADVPELLDLPWEYLYNQSLNRFMALSVETPLVRYLDLPERIQPLHVRPPLKMLVMISSPSDYPALDVEREWTKLNEALRDLIQRGKITLERLESATLAALQKQLRRDEYHIFHFVGHGGFNEQAQDGVLLMETDERRGRAVGGSDLGVLLHDERTLRLVVLNACEGARASRTDPFAGTAQSLVQQGLPAVIGMQFEISDAAAITFSREFYSAVADGYPVDAALAEARKAIFAEGNPVEWGTPVLYLRAPDGRVFDIERVSATEQIQVAAKQQPAPMPVAPPAPPPVEAQPRQPPGIKPLWLAAGLGGLALLIGVILLGVLAGPAILAPTPTLTPSPTATLTPSPTATPVPATITPTATRVTLTPSRTGTPAPAGITATPSRTSTPTPARAITWKSVTVLRGHTGSVSSVAFSPVGRGDWVITAGWDDVARVWSTDSWRQAEDLRGHSAELTSVAFSPNGKLVATGSKDRTARVWSVANWRDAIVLRGHTDAVNSVAFSSDSRVVLTGSSDRTLRLWDAATGREMAVFRLPNSEVTGAAYSPDNQLIASSSKDGILRLWDPGSGRMLAELSGHSGVIWSVDFSLDGKYIVTGGADKLAIVWDVSTRQAVAKLSGHQGVVNSVAFSPDGRWVITASSDTTARIWEAGTWQSATELRGHTAEVFSAAFSPDGKWVVTGSADDTARVWGQ